MWEAIGGIASALGGMFGGNKAAKAQYRMFKKQLQFQRDAATHGIQWKVKDARKAGIHPVYALGAPTFSPAPISADTSGYASAGESLGRGVSQVAQAMAAKRQNKLQEDLLKAQIDKTQAEADAVASQAQAYKLNMLRQHVTGVGKPRPTPEIVPGISIAAKRPWHVSDALGDYIRVDTSRSDADTVASEYGDFWSEVYGFVKGVEDYYRTHWENAKAAWKAGRYF